MLSQKPLLVNKYMSKLLWLVAFAVLCFVDVMHSGIKMYQVCFCFIDFLKTFDKVKHTIVPGFIMVNNKIVKILDI